MFIALDCDGNRISIEIAVQKNKYYCPICGEILTIKAKDSLAVKTHFSHKRGCLCVDDWSHDMSEWHLEWQKKFPEQYREVIIKKDGVKHRADICIGNTIIEFQHSPISNEEIIKRNNFYISCGYQVVWVFDATDKIKNSIEESIDPMRCRDDDLCWKRPKKEFIRRMPPHVTVFLQYKTNISNNKFSNQQFDIMLLTTRVEAKNIWFYKTMPFYIMPINFLKEYGVVHDSTILSVKDIIDQTKSYLNQLKLQQFGQPKVVSSPRRHWHL